VILKLQQLKGPLFLLGTDCIRKTTSRKCLKVYMYSKTARMYDNHLFPAKVVLLEGWSKLKVSSLIIIHYNTLCIGKKINKWMVYLNSLPGIETNQHQVTTLTTHILAFASL